MSQVRNLSRPRENEPMPLLKIHTSAAPPSAEQARELLKTASALLARELHKPEAYVMTCLTPRAQMTFAGTSTPACYAEVKNIGELSHDTTRRLSAELCTLLASALGVERSRVYIGFSDVAPHMWGFDGDTFA
jgi:phenylpyruvate tautomerase